MKCIHLSFIFLLFSCSELNSQQDGSEEVYYWTKGYQLKLNDFVVIRDSDSTKFARNFSALSRTGVVYQLKYKDDKPNVVEIDIQATFHPSNSYVKQHVLQLNKVQLEYLLRHEQRHFDISEIYAREATKILLETKLTHQYRKEINDIMASIFKSSNEYQDQYDTETQNGNNWYAQEKWNEKINTRLDNLRSYASKIIVKPIQGL